MNTNNFDFIINLNILIILGLIHRIDKNIDFDGYIDEEYLLQSYNEYLPSTFNYVSHKIFFDLKFKMFRNKYDTECLICSNDQYIFVSFNGLQTNLDIISDIKQMLLYKSTNLHNTNFIVHENFVNSLIDDDFILKLFHTIDIFYNNKQKIYINGHSMGGIIAAIFSYFFYLKYPDIQFYLNIFGTPNFCNDSFFHFLHSNSNIFFSNIYTFNDISPILPIIPFVNDKNKIYIIDNTIQIYHNYTFSIFNNNSIQKHNIDFYFNQITNIYLN